MTQSATASDKAALIAELMTEVDMEMIKAEKAVTIAVAFLHTRRAQLLLRRVLEANSEKRRELS